MRFLLVLYGTVSLLAIIGFIVRVPLGLKVVVDDLFYLAGFVITVVALHFGRFTAGRMPEAEESDSGLIAILISIVKTFSGKERLPYYAVLPIPGMILFNTVWSIVASIVGIFVR
jgi:hypothetical protein